MLTAIIIFFVTLILSVMIITIVSVILFGFQIVKAFYKSRIEIKEFFKEVFLDPRNYREDDDSEKELEDAVMAHESSVGH